jgi:nitric oxide reductase NorQ protein
LFSIPSLITAANSTWSGSETLEAAPGFCLVVSYNPGYESVLKDLKDSTGQRMVAIELGFPPDVEHKIIATETGLDPATSSILVAIGQAIRGAGGSPLMSVRSFC